MRDDERDEYLGRWISDREWKQRIAIGVAAGFVLGLVVGALA